MDSSQICICALCKRAISAILIEVISEEQDPNISLNVQTIPYTVNAAGMFVRDFQISVCLQIYANLHVVYQFYINL